MRKAIVGLMAGAAWSLGTWSAAALDLVEPKAWSEPAAPFRISDNIYYVGSKGLAAYLIVSGKEAILLDGTLDRNVAGIEKNTRSLGFQLGDVKIILNSHAHFDHAAGIARLKKDTGAAVMATVQDKPALESGEPDGETNYGVARFPAVKVDRALNDGDLVKLGDVELTATLTPGHTKGCTTWSMTAQDNGVARRVVFPCSVSVAGNILAGNRRYPGIVEDYRKSFERLASMQADIVLPAHPELAELWERKAKRDAGDKEAFVDRGLLGRMVVEARTAFEKQLKKSRN